MNSLCSQEQVVEFLGDTSSDGTQSVQSSGNPIPQAFCAPDKMMAFSRLSRFGMTFAPLKESHGEELLTLYRAAFHAPTFPQQEKEQELMEKPLECGEKWHGSFTKYDPDLSLWRTHQCSLLGDLEEFSETWPQWGLMRNGECWEQQTLAHLIKETESGLLQNKWPTPTSSDWMNPKQNGIELKNNRFVRTSLTTGTKFGAKLSDAVNLEMKKNWPTPQVVDYKDRGNLSNPSIQRRMKIGKQVNLQMCVSQTSGQLNPMWVEWLMGWPQGWTELKPSEMDKSPSALPMHGES
jgi:hypothetical protein